MSKDVNEPHRIRLAGPWLRVVVNGSNAEPRTVKMPSSLDEALGENFCGCVEYQRFFNRPTGLDDSMPVRLRLLNIRGDATISLNGKNLGSLSFGTESFDISTCLEQRNDLRVQISVAEQAKTRSDATECENEELGFGLVGEVRLEIG